MGKQDTISAEVIHEEDEDGASSEMAQSKPSGLSVEEQEAKRKGIRDLIFKSEYNFGGLLFREETH